MIYHKDTSMQIPNCEDGKTPESKIKKVLFNEVNFVLAIVAIVGTIYFGFFSVQYRYQKQIDDIKNTIDTTTKLSAQLQNLKDNDMHTLAQNDAELKQQNQDILIAIAKLQTIVEGLKENK